VGTDRVSRTSHSGSFWTKLIINRVAATIYHLFLAEDNSPELFAQLRRIHSLVPYSWVKNVVRFSNPATVMSGILDIFLLQPFGARSLLQRIFGLAIHDGIVNIQKSIEQLVSQKIEDPVIVEKIRRYTEADEDIKNDIKQEAADEQIDLLVAIIRAKAFEPEATTAQIEYVFNAYVAWNHAVENVSNHSHMCKSNVLSEFLGQR
jgi:hypothetical protein